MFQINNAYIEKDGVNVKKRKKFNNEGTKILK